MKFKILNNEPLHFYNTYGDLIGTISVSGSGDMLIRPESGSTKNIIIGNADTAGDIEVGLVSTPVNFTMLGGGTITSNGNTLNIGSTDNGDTVNIYNVTYSQSLYITGSVNTTGSMYADFFVGDGSGLTNLQRSITSSNVNFSASSDNAGYYFRAGGNVTCSIGTNASLAIDTGTEYEFFQTSSADNMIFQSGSGVTLNSKNGNLNLAGQFSSAILKKVDTDEWDLMGDLT
jgi:hypothetical protein